MHSTQKNSDAFNFGRATFGLKISEKKRTNNIRVLPALKEKQNISTATQKVTGSNDVNFTHSKRSQRNSVQKLFKSEALKEQDLLNGVGLLKERITFPEVPLLMEIFRDPNNSVFASQPEFPVNCCFPKGV